MLDAYLLEWIKFKRTKLGPWLPVFALVYSFVIVFFMSLNRSYFLNELQFLDVVYQSNVLLSTIVGPFFYGGITIYYFYRPMKQGTERTMALLPLGKLKFFFVQLAFLLSLNILLGLVMLLGNVAFSLVFGFQGIDNLALIQGLYATNNQVALMFLLQMPILFCIVTFRNQISAIAVMAFSVISTLIMADSKVMYLYPYTAVYGYVEGTSVEGAYLGMQNVPYLIILFGVSFIALTGYQISRHEY